MSRTALRTLAELLGVQPGYQGWNGAWVEATDAALAAMVTALAPGYGLTLPAELGDDACAAAAAALAKQRATAGAPPVLVAWDAAPVTLAFAVRADVDGDWTATLWSEAGHEQRHYGTLFTLDPRAHRDLDGVPYCERCVTLTPPGLGYHQIEWQIASADGAVRTGTCLLIAAPTQACALAASPSDTVPAKRWGVFAPLYDLKSPVAGGLGDFATLRALAESVQQWGGRYVATLPLLAGFFSEPCQISPYSPASRLFWNELYVDLADAAARVGVAGNIDAVGVLERARLYRYAGLDYRAQYAWRRAELDRLAAAAFALPLTAAALHDYATRTPDVVDYAVFRSIGEALRLPWSQWPAEWRDALAPVRRLEDVPAHVDLQAVRTHVFVQWVAEQQLASVTAGLDVGLYLDLPVGVNRDAYEVWRQRSQFVLAAGAGAPPDELFLGGQNWGLPPLHPYAIRRDGYRYFIACLREHMRHAALLRIDHVMGLFRLYCVPEGLAATDGVYISYTAEELLAIVTLESVRAGCAVVGEDLGTVPDYVPPAMARHGLLGLHVGQFNLPSEATQPRVAVGARVVASLNTHDTATFAGWWRGSDIDDRAALGLISAARQQAEHASRASARQLALTQAVGAIEGWRVGVLNDAGGAGDTTARRVDAEPLVAALSALLPPAPTSAAEDEAACGLVMRAETLGLAASAAPVVLLTLEDLWLEPLPQNVPGTSSERPNWQRPYTRQLPDWSASGPLHGFFSDSYTAAPVATEWLALVSAFRTS